MSKKLPFFLLFCLILFSCKKGAYDLVNQPQGEEGSAAVAHFVSQQQASDAAGLFLANSGDGSTSKSNSTAKTVKTIETIKDQSGKALIYVINYDGGGFALVSATKKYYPILAYSETNTFSLDMSVLNLGLTQWINQAKTAIVESDRLDAEQAALVASLWFKYQPDSDLKSTPQVGRATKNTGDRTLFIRRMTELKDHGIDGWRFSPLTAHQDANFYNRAKSTAEYHGSPLEYTIVGIRDQSSNTTVGPLLATQWHQHAPYNALCPDQSAAGCVAIAVAQIMRFHQHPRTAFDWSNIPIADATTTTQQFIHEVGVAANTTYGKDESSSTDEKAAKALRKYGYNVSIKHTRPPINSIKQQLAARRPIYIGGSNGSSGHAWVCDGYTYNLTEYDYYIEYLCNGGKYDNFGETLLDNPESSGSGYSVLHFNWGWMNGQNTGWYYDYTAVYPNSPGYLYITPN